MFCFILYIFTNIYWSSRMSNQMISTDTKNATSKLLTFMQNNEWPLRCDKEMNYPNKKKNRGFQVFVPFIEPHYHQPLLYSFLLQNQNDSKTSFFRRKHFYWYLNVGTVETSRNSKTQPVSWPIIEADTQTLLEYWTADYWENIQNVLSWHWPSLTF